jgi:hypothetical protein
MLWLERHCFRGCVNEGQCHIQDQLEDGAMTDGTISKACACIALPTCAAYKLDHEWTPPPVRRKPWWITRQLRAVKLALSIWTPIRPRDPDDYYIPLWLALKIAWGLRD